MKYRLKKSYPGVESIKEGSVIEGPYYITTYMKTSIDVRNYPEYWEEVIEKDYEVLIMKGSGSAFTTYENHKKTYSDTHVHYFLKSGVWSIHSVKRLSDGEIFTIGDKTNFGLISKIVIINNSLSFYFEEKCCGYGLKIIIKWKPLFTTEDGVDIFEGDKVWWVAVNEEYDTPSGDKTWSFNEFVWKGKPTASSNYKWFSTKEKAEEYIIMNKPCLSFNDVINYIHEEFVGKLKTRDAYPHLEKIVKSKL